jgi:hypothetical protein
MEVDMLARCNFGKESRPGEKLLWTGVTEVKHAHPGGSVELRNSAVRYMARTTPAGHPQGVGGSKMRGIAGEEEKKWLPLVKRFCVDMVRENANRAV